MFQYESGLGDDAADVLLTRYGPRLGTELAALADLATLFQYNGVPWAVSETSLMEPGRVRGERGRVLLRWWWDWRRYLNGWSEAYPEIDHGGLMWPGAVVHSNQLALFRDGADDAT